jgi:subtilisin family serine protease
LKNLKAKSIMMNKKKDRYVLLIDEEDKSALHKTEKEFGTKITSSAELSAKIRAQNIYESGNALYLKNLGIIVIEDQEEEKINRFTAKRNSPVKHYERSKMIFRPVQEMDLLKQLKESAETLSKQINELEEYLINQNKPAKDRLTWGLNALNLNASQLDGQGVDVCILDTGFYRDHPDFSEREITGKSFVPDQSWEKDPNGHGTHCTGTATGYKSSENGIRYGIASRARIAIGKVLDDEGNGALDWILDALDNCIEKEYSVVSMSFGATVAIGEAPNPLFEHVGQLAMQKNCLLIAAAGNESNRPALPRPVNMPANCESIMAVAALERSLKVADFSNAGINVSDGGKVDVAAPGVGVYSSFSPNAHGNELYATLQGTSMATPHVSGLAALYFQAFPALSAADIWRKMEKKARQLNDQLIRDVGNGIVQAI